MRLLLTTFFSQELAGLESITPVVSATVALTFER